MVFLFLSVPAMAQNAPSVEFFGGYSHVIADMSNTSFSLDGTEVSMTQNLNNWFGGTLDFGTQYGSRNGFNVNMQQIMYGPVFAYRKSSAFTPFGHVLLGAVRGSQGFAGISQPAFKFGGAFGGGLDIRLNKRFSVRVIQADYLMSRFLGTRQNNLRVSAGIVLTFGKAK
jgi:hypothetical protein